MKMLIFSREDRAFAADGMVSKGKTRFHQQQLLGSSTRVEGDAGVFQTLCEVRSFVLAMSATST